MAARLLLLMFVGALVFGQQTRLDDAWNLAAAGKRDEAIRILQGLITTEPKNPDARLLLGSLLVEKEDRGGAIEQLSEAVRLRPHSAEAQNALGEAYNRFDEPKKARAYFERAVALDPTLAAAQINLGLVALESSEYETARQDFSNATRTSRDSAETAYAHYLWAKAYTALNQPKEAALHLEQAVKLNPEMGEAWADLGEARKLLLDDAGTLAAEKRAVELNPRDAIAQYRLGAEYLRQNQQTPALEHLRAAAELDPHDQSTLNALLIALRRSGKLDEANAVKQQLSDLLRERDTASQDSVAAVKLNNDGAALEKSGDLQAALTKYATAVKLYPSHAGIRVNYAVLLLRLGKWSEGLGQLQEAQRRNPNDPDIQAALKDALAQAPPGVR